MVDRAIDDKSSNTLVVVSGEGFWTGSSTLPHLHHFFALREGTRLLRACVRAVGAADYGAGLAEIRAAAWCESTVDRRRTG